MSLRIFASALCLIAAALIASPVAAQSGQPLTISVTPEVAEPGVVRTIRVSGRWPDRCSVPGGISVVALPFPTASGGLTLTPSSLIVFSPCPPTGPDVSLTTTHTPQVAGVQTLTLTHSGQFIVQGKLITRPINGARAGADITGAWHDPAVPGHGFSLYHAQSGSDLMAGAWYAYDSAGKPYWLLVNNVRWNDSSRFIGDLFDITSTAGNCTLLPGCARPQIASTQVGRVNGELLTDGKLRLVISAGPPFADPPFPNTIVLERLSF